MDSYLTRRQAAAALGVTTSTIRKYERAGWLAPVHADRVYYAEAEVEALATKRRGAFRPAAIEASVPSAAAAVSTWPAAAASNALQGPACSPLADSVTTEVYVWLIHNGWYSWDAHRAAVAAWQASVMVPCGDVQRVRAIAWAAAWGVLGSAATSWHFQ